MMERIDSSTPERGLAAEKLPSLWLQWFGVLAAPIAWGAHLSFQYFFVTLECQLDTENADIFLHVVTPLALLLAVAGGAAAVYAFIRVERMMDGSAWHRSRFMSAAGMLLTAYFTLGIFMDIAYVYSLSHCNPGA